MYLLQKYNKYINIMVKIYNKDVAKSYSDKNPGDPIYAGTTYYKNKKDKTVLIESWCSSST